MKIHRYFLLALYAVMQLAVNLEAVPATALNANALARVRPISSPQMKKMLRTSENEYVRKLYQRIESETNEAIKGSILDNNSLPIQANRSQWIDAFVNMYGSAPLLPPLTAQKSAQIKATLNNFFTSVNFETMSPEQLARALENVQDLYLQLPDRLKLALEERLFPYVTKRVHETAQKAANLEEQLEKAVERVQLADKKIEDAVSEGRSKQEIEALQQQREAAVQQAQKTEEAAWTLNQKLLVGVGVAAVIGSGAALAVYGPTAVGAALYSAGSTALGWGSSLASGAKALMRWGKQPSTASEAMLEGAGQGVEILQKGAAMGARAAEKQARSYLGQKPSARAERISYAGQMTGVEPYSPDVSSPLATKFLQEAGSEISQGPVGQAARRVEEEARAFVGQEPSAQALELERAGSFTAVDPYSQFSRAERETARQAVQEGAVELPYMTRRAEERVRGWVGQKPSAAAKRTEEIQSLTD